MATGYPQMTKALNATNRPIVFSCLWPDYVSPKVSARSWNKESKEKKKNGRDKRKNAKEEAIIKKNEGLS